MANLSFLRDADIKVLMLGARRVGKTSLVASMISDQFRQKAVNGTDLEIVVDTDGQEEVINTFKTVEKMMANYFVADIPIRNVQDTPETQNTEVRTALSTFKLDGAPSVKDMNFTVSLKTTKKNSSYKIQFIDIPGEWIDTYRSTISDGDKRTLQSLVTNADVLVIVSDSVLVMEDNGNNSRIANRIDNITTIIRENASGKIDKPEKLVMFAPAKCELYFNRHMEMIKNTDPLRFHGDTDPMPLLMAQIQKHYCELINWLTSNGNERLFDVAILPVLTLGNIEFSHIDPYTKNTPGSRLNSDIFYGYYKGDAFASPDAIFHNDFMSVPNYAPQYCEQPLTMILLYQLSKLKKIKEDRAWWKKVGKMFFDLFGSIAKDEDLLKAIPQLRKNLAVNSRGYVSTIIQDPVSGVKALTTTEE